MGIQVRDVKPFEQYCIDEFSMCHDDGDFECDALGFYESVETERLWRIWELQAAKAQAVPEGFVLVPREPTKDTLIEIASVCIGDDFANLDEAKELYKTMIEAQEPK